ARWTSGSREASTAIGRSGLRVSVSIADRQIGAAVRAVIRPSRTTLTPSPAPDPRAVAAPTTLTLSSGIPPGSVARVCVGAASTGAGYAAADTYRRPPGGRLPRREAASGLTPAEGRSAVTNRSPDGHASQRRWP